VPRGITQSNNRRRKNKIFELPYSRLFKRNFKMTKNWEYQYGCGTYAYKIGVHFFLCGYVPVIDLKSARVCAITEIKIKICLN
jgi:hypothetical protein